MVLLMAFITNPWAVSEASTSLTVNEDVPRLEESRCDLLHIVTVMKSFLGAHKRSIGTYREVASREGNEIRLEFRKVAVEFALKDRKSVV